LKCGGRGGGPGWLARLPQDEATRHDMPIMNSWCRRWRSRVREAAGQPGACSRYLHGVEAVPVPRDLAFPGRIVNTPGHFPERSGPFIDTFRTLPEIRGTCRQSFQTLAAILGSCCRSLQTLSQTLGRYWPTWQAPFRKRRELSRDTSEARWNPLRQTLLRACRAGCSLSMNWQVCKIHTYLHGATHGSDCRRTWPDHPAQGRA
jgi:hypothetical protein